MSKLLLLIVVIAGILWFLLLQRKREAQGKVDAPSARPPEKMVTCARCGVHLPESEALLVAGRHYCCAEHGQLGPNG